MSAFFCLEQLALYQFFDQGAHAVSARLGAGQDTFDFRPVAEAGRRARREHQELPYEVAR
jgi:hypothetical protein